MDGSKTSKRAPGLASTVVVLLCLLGQAARAESVSIWISSFQDKIYYEEMAERYRSEVDESFRAEVRAFGFREMPDKLAVAIQTRTNEPDIVQLDEVFFGMYLRGTPPYVDLTQRVKDAGLDETILPQRLSLFSHGGKVWGLPQSLSAMVLYYRRDLFQRYGITAAQLQTWDDVLRIGRELVAEHGQSFLAMDPSYFGILLRQRGGQLFDEEGNFLPDMDLAVDTLEFMAELSRSGVGLMPDRGSLFDPVFFEGDVANNEIMAIVGADWYGLDMIQQFSSHLAGQWGIMPLPAWSGGDPEAVPVRTSTFAGQGLVIYHRSPQVEACWDFIEWVMTDPEANARRFLSGNSFPAYKPAFDDPRLLQPQPFFGGDSMGQILVMLAPYVPEVAMNAKRPMAVFMMREGMLNEAIFGRMEAREALERMKERVESEGPPRGEGG